MAWYSKKSSSNDPSYLEPRISDIEATINTSPKYKIWTATAGQLTYTFDTDSYNLGQLTVWVGGVPQVPVAIIQEDSPTQFTLLVDASEITSGLNVVAVYR